jgi:hypothetical protein
MAERDREIYMRVLKRKAMNGLRINKRRTMMKVA